MSAIAVAMKNAYSTLTSYNNQKALNGIKKNIIYLRLKRQFFLFVFRLNYIYNDNVSKLFLILNKLFH